jgi:hypothetical protein
MIGSEGGFGQAVSQAHSQSTVNHGVRGAHIGCGGCVRLSPRHTPRKGIPATNEQVPLAVLVSARPCSSVLVPFIVRVRRCSYRSTPALGRSPQGMNAGFFRPKEWRC